MSLLVLGLAIGVATVVALTAIMETMEAEVAQTLDEFGANILVVPKSNGLSLSYGGVAVASAAYDVSEMTLTDLQRISTIKNARNVSVVSPKLLAAMPINGQQVLVAGVLFDDEIRLKKWWQVQGEYPAAPEEMVAGTRVAEALGIRPGDTIQLEEKTVRLAGILTENGSSSRSIKDKRRQGAYQGHATL